MLNREDCRYYICEIVGSIFKNKFSARDFDKYKLVKQIDTPAHFDTHRLKNLLGNMRNQCEVFLLNRKDGIFNATPQKDLDKISEEIMQDVINTVDQVMKVLEDFKKEK